MFGLPLVFSYPFVLAALLGLPLIYFLLRVSPPSPRRVPFPPLRLVLDLGSQQETPLRTPWWLLLLRLFIALLIILAMAGPVLNPLSSASLGQGPLLIILDDGWPAAPMWEQRIEAASLRIEEAARHAQPVAIVATSDAGREIVLGNANAGLQRLRLLRPVPFVPDRLEIEAPVERFLDRHPEASIIWIFDGIARGHANEFAEELASKKQETIVVSDAEPVRGLAGPQNTAAGLKVRVLRSRQQGDAQGNVRALDLKGFAVGEAPFDFQGASETEVIFDLPIEVRNEIARLEISGENSAAAVSLLDERWKRRRVGLITGATADVAQPLLSPNYYLVRALAPFADTREARPGTDDPVSGLLEEQVSVMVLSDIGNVSGPAHEALMRFVEDGGVLLRFAGTRLAGVSDDLVPVRLRRGGRVLGGSMSWDTPKKLADFERESPFFGLAVPDEVTVSRQVLAEPEPGLSAKTWAQLSDGTPLVTASRKGKGLIILFHVTADTTWSNLPLSGLFVEMLQKIIALSGETVSQAPTEAAKDGVGTLAPYRILDGFGRLGVPPALAKPIPAGFDAAADADHPPGFYGPQNALFAVNTLGPSETIEAADFSSIRINQAPLRQAEPSDLKPWLIALAFFLFLADALISLLRFGGGISLWPRRASVVILLLGCGLLLAGTMNISAEPARPALPARDLESALSTRLAYVTSGDPKVDEISKQGLLSLSQVLARRTSLTPGDPVAVDPARDELSFYPLLYWPIVAGRDQPPAAAITKTAAFMKNGGTIIFDTRDALTARPGGPPTPETLWLRRLLEGVDVPELEPVPADHVVTKAFYLIDGFIGRYALGQTWIEALPPAPADGSPRPARAGDSVSPIIITGNDLAAGWASDSRGESLYSLVPGGRRQHELALRGGVNLVMYTLTGNYKADQVHVRDLLERLGH
jgi:hypothetical protein